MKKNLMFVLPIMFSLIASGAQAYIEAEPYVGADLQIRQTRFKKNFGSNLFNKNLVQVNPFVGLMFCENLGLEFGYEHGFYKNANAVRTQGDIVLGVPLQAPIVTERSTNSVEVFGPNLSVIGTVDICPDYGTSLIASIGVSRLKAKIRYQITQLNDLVLGTVGLEQVRQDFRKTKNVLRVMGGVQQMVSDCAGVRFTLVYENTSKFRINSSRPTSTNTARLKDSFNYGIGVFWKF